MAGIKDIRPDVQEASVGVLGGRERVIKFDLNAFAEVESRFGSIDELMDQVSTGSLTALKKMAWAGLLHDEVTLDEFTGDVLKYHITPYEVGSWITMDKFNIVSEALTKVVTGSMPVPKEAAKIEATEIKEPEVKVIPTKEEEKEAKNE